MDDRDRMAIDELFGKLAEVERRSGPRDAEAEEHIRSLIGRQPAAPYYMAQTIVVQEQALNEAQRRIDELERDASEPAAGGFLGGLFGTGRTERPGRYAQPPRGAQTYGPWDSSRGMGGGFLAGAAQTAMGVAGGVLLGNMLADWLTPDASEHAANAGLFGDDRGSQDDSDPQDASDTQVADAGDFDGNFDSGDL